MPGAGLAVDTALLDLVALLVVDCGFAILHCSLIFPELLSKVDEFRFFVPFSLPDGVPKIQNFRLERVNFPCMPIYLLLKFPSRNRSVIKGLVLLTTETVCSCVPLEVVCPPKLLIKYLSPFPKGSAGSYSLIAITLEIE